jgi:hypothetical protein
MPCGEDRLDELNVPMNTIPSSKVPEFDLYYVAYLKSDPAKEPVAASYSAPGVLSEAAHKTGKQKRILNFGRSAGKNTSGSNRYCSSSVLSAKYHIFRCSCRLSVEQARLLLRQ